MILAFKQVEKAFLPTLSGRQVIVLDAQLTEVILALRSLRRAAADRFRRV